jgi:hypothetical protein
MAREAGIDAWWDSGGDWRETFNEHLKAFEALVRADQHKAEQAEHDTDKTVIHYHEATIKRLKHNNEVLMNALWKACGDDEDLVQETLESQEGLA